MDSVERIVEINPKLGTRNPGDIIINEACSGIIDELFENSYRYEISTRQVMTSYSYDLLRDSDYKFVLGTNLIASDMKNWHQWELQRKDMRYVSDLILLGVGWCQYQGDVTKYTRKLLKSILSQDKLHSVRDSYTEQKLQGIGICNVVNTSCPTLWGISEKHCKSIPVNKADSVVTTLNMFRRDYEMDRRLLHFLCDSYKKVYVWVEEYEENRYLQEICDLDRINVLAPSVAGFDNILTEDIDYIGIRLHPGIRAIQKGVRTLIIGIDNRAIEISKDVNLNVCTRENMMERLRDFCCHSYITNIKLPMDNIIRWKMQFGFSA